MKIDCQCATCQVYLLGFAAGASAWTEREAPTDRVVVPADVQTLRTEASFRAADAFVRDMTSRGVVRLDDPAVRYHLSLLLKKVGAGERSHEAPGGGGAQDGAEEP